MHADVLTLTPITMPLALSLGRLTESEFEIRKADSEAWQRRGTQGKLPTAPDLARMHREQQSLEETTLPPPGTAVTTRLLSSEKSIQYNNRKGTVVAPPAGTAIKPGRVAVLLDDETKPISFKLMNIRV